MSTLRDAMRQLWRKRGATSDEIEESWFAPGHPVTSGDAMTSEEPGLMWPRGPISRHAAMHADDEVSALKLRINELLADNDRMRLELSGLHIALRVLGERIEELEEDEHGCN